MASQDKNERRAVHQSHLVESYLVPSAFPRPAHVGQRFRGDGEWCAVSALRSGEQAPHCV